MADIRDEHGNPIQLTDEHGQQVKLTDEHGVPMHLTGVATTVHSSQNVGTTIGSEPKMHGGTHFSSTPTEPFVGVGVETVPAGGGPIPCHPGTEGQKQQFGQAGSSSSSSSEDDEEGGRRKKKGLMQKIKDKLPGHKKKDQEQVPEKVYTATTKVTVTTPGGPLGEPKTEHIHVEHHEEEHEKKGLMDKIMDKLPGHH